MGLNFYHPKRVKAPDAIPVISPSWSPEWYYDPSFQHTGVIAVS
ncbi:beta-glucosidase [Bacillus cereus W]|nr:beta-glucosidase [Bacillus cereus W]